MNKREFLEELRKGLSALPQSDVEERLTFYCEMIDDRIEEGLSEEAAVRAVGSPDGIVAQIIADTPLAKLVKEKIKPKKTLGAWEITLLILGSPIWLSLLISVFAVIISLYASLWAVIISLWASFAAVVAASFGVTVVGIVFVACVDRLIGIAFIGCGIACAGVSIFFFYLCKAATKGALFLTKKAALGIKNSFIKKGGAQ